jgi:hypothetical protein
MYRHWRRRSIPKGVHIELQRRTPELAETYISVILDIWMN